MEVFLIGIIAGASYLAIYRLTAKGVDSTDYIARKIGELDDRLYNLEKLMLFKKSYTSKSRILNGKEKPKQA